MLVFRAAMLIFRAAMLVFQAAGGTRLGEYAAKCEARDLLWGIR